MDKLETAHAMARRMNAAEDAIDHALRAGAELLGALTVARVDLDLSAVVGGEAFDRMSAALVALTCARAETVACHDVLARMQVRAGLGAVSLGEGQKTPPPSGALEAEPAGAASAGSARSSVRALRRA